ncbi:probable pectinesterase/pectinesterase inhibitor 12 [Magnolia sinica]|uniref:probable pectinesterase/pectinesterase inhibitor 12 n=1 Tax=Magnolia sinica TaxID=86752 RepID=UPI002658206B|nr:probable pectinesterase/pectinesterase inhibitor 12 [Magnolia sinica]
MASSSSFLLKAILVISLLHFIKASSFNISTPSASPSLKTHLTNIKSLCKNTPYPDTCFNSMKLSISININPNILNYLLQSLQTALSEASKLSNLFYDANTATGIVENQKGTLQDCKELHQITVSSLKKSVSRLHSSKQSGVAAYLSAALTNKNTCLEGLESASGPLKPKLVSSTVEAYKHVSNSLSILAGSRPAGGNNRRRLLGFPTWMSKEDRRVLEGSDDEYDPGSILTVAADGSGNFTTISDAISFAPNNSMDRIIILVKEGVYLENVAIPSYKTNVVLLGDGSEVTVIRGNRSVGDGWTTFRSATVAVSGDGFLARDISFENTAGPSKHQAVALRVNGDLAAIYRCTIDGYQDTLYVHSFRQFYRECDIFGTVDFIFGNAAVIFQGCNIVAKKPMRGQFNAITAQSRDDEYEVTGISIQNCSILASEDLSSDIDSVKSYLGRPWKVYSRTVYIESYIDQFIDPAGWTEWSGDQGLDTLYYGEYSNSGPGSVTDYRVTWPGFHVMDYYDALNFTVSDFIAGDEWLESTSFPYDDGI